ncbi:uncharacterized protein LOC116192797 [Punica granatum]|uniref:RING-type domain-containing protein n=2 Tax=Punica granatum TaxID=22663 RepID=A0A218VRW6_PUNGR|nr:uncharacterized protein LOC116192797 [Punica granatum]OWM63245.1 hypothetical protein CDL15_Pgr010645 [Punica granatum]PKI76439.1 hypothetical protein CRG98_003159 [Punica granatum]
MKREHDHSPAASAHCGECGGGSSAEERWLLHNVRHKATYRRLCTHCVLNCFRGHFCPVCLDVFDPIDSPPRPNQRVMCLNCPSISHLSCATSNSGGHPFQCPSCSNPNFSFFTLRTVPASNKRIKPEAEADCSLGGGRDGDIQDRRAIDKESAKALVAAARIAAATMSKAAHTARIEAERRVKEAALARKRAREALERVAFLSLKEKERELKVTANGGLGIVQEQKMKPRVTSSVLENNQAQDQIPSQGADRLGGVPVMGNAQGDKGTNGLHSVLPVSAQNQQKNHLC